MKFYIATKLENHKQHNEVRDRLIKLGHSITYDWTPHGPVYKQGLERVREVAHLETEGVKQADFIVVLWPSGRGTHVELGVALGLGKRVFMYSTVPEHFEATNGTCAFYHHSLVLLSDTISCLINQIRNFGDV